MNETHHSSDAALRILRKGTRNKPVIGLILGSGFGGLAAAVEAECEFAFQELPGFPVGTVPGHSQRLIMGSWRTLPVVILQGRAHYYEGFTMDRITFPTRVLAALGIRSLLVTNAAGGLNPKYRVGDFVGIRDHLNLMGDNPLRGQRSTERSIFVDLCAAYDATLLSWLRQAGRRANVRCHSGVYCAVGGPSFETPAEIKAFRRLGADTVGMSTVPEVITARHCGLRVAGLSCVTNLAAGLGTADTGPNHNEVLRAAKEREPAALRFLQEFLSLVERNESR